jgi:hypothetical protein
VPASTIEPERKPNRETHRTKAEQGLGLNWDFGLTFVHDVDIVAAGEEVQLVGHQQTRLACQLAYSAGINATSARLQMQTEFEQITGDAAREDVLADVGVHGRQRIVHHNNLRMPTRQFKIQSLQYDAANVRPDWSRRRARWQRAAFGRLHTDKAKPE